MLHEYTATPENRLRQDILYNEKVVALRRGEVIDIEEDNVRIHLEIDKDQKKMRLFGFLFYILYFRR